MLPAPFSRRDVLKGAARALKLYGQFERAVYDA